MGKASRAKTERRTELSDIKKQTDGRKWVFPAVVGGVTVLLLVLVIVFASGGPVRNEKETQAKGDPEIGKEAPEVSGTNVQNGKELALSDFQGKPTLVTFWAHWCPFCQKELPVVQSFYEQNKSKYNFMTVSLGEGQKPAKPEFADTQAFIKTNGVTMPTVKDESGAFAKTWNVTSFPTFYVIAPDGKVAQKLTGAQTPAELEAALSAAASESPPPGQ